jgi:hypothetical protein
MSKTLCLAFAAMLAVASLATPASARWGDQNDHRGEQRNYNQGWNNNYYAAPPVVYQNYGNNGYYPPPVVVGGYGSGINLNINIP